MRPDILRVLRYLCAVLAVGAMTVDNIDAQSAVQPVLFRIVLPHAVLCVVDRHLEVEAELRNTSGRQLSLSPAGLLAQVSFTNRASSLEDGFRSKNSSSDQLPGRKDGKVVTLAPGESYRQVLKLELDPDFFTPGVYRIQISFSAGMAGLRKKVSSGTADSNEALFEVDDCQPEKDQ
ncbi:MAG: hypothetical protein U0V70_10190 [Terriglobia bacterium]